MEGCARGRGGAKGQVSRPGEREAERARRGAKWGAAVARRRRGFFPHFTPPWMTWCFTEASGGRMRFGELTGEKCGVKWGTME